MQVSTTKEKALVLVGTSAAAVTGYLAAVGRPLEAGLIGTVAGSILAFWSQAVNTEPKTE